MKPFNVPDTGKQIYVAAFLAKLADTGLHKALNAAAARCDPAELRSEMAQFAPADGLILLQGSGVRDEEVFAVPAVFRQQPGVLAYYRLLLGISQKQFYTKNTELNLVKPLEERQTIPESVEPRLGELCSALNGAMSKLLHALPDGSIRTNVDQLPLLALGAQADGSWRTTIGSSATNEVFEALKGIVKDAQHHFTETPASITVRNSSGRDVTLQLASDPDVVIREDFGGTSEYKAAIEIKGGSDYSNIHNRAGEAEKSHQKAQKDGAGTCWTVINLSGAVMSTLRSESPTTREWVDFVEVQRRTGPTWDRLVQLTRAAMGI